MIGLRTIAYRLKNLRSQLTFCDKGIVAVEFAMAVPFLLLMAIGSVEMGRMIMVHERMSRVASTAADLSARVDVIDNAGIAEIVAAASQVASPFAFATNGQLILSSASDDGTVSTILWQDNNGASLGSSKVGVAGSAPTLPNGLTLSSGEGVVVAEVYYTYTPLLGSYLFQPTTLYKVAQQRPRLGVLIRN